MSTMKDLHDQYMAGLRNHTHAAQNAMYAQQAMNQQIGIQNMAGAATGIAMGAANGHYAQNSYQPWGQQLSPSQVRDKTRLHIANEVEKMAEEIGAPTLLHAVVLTIRTMEIPE